MKSIISPTSIIAGLLVTAILTTACPSTPETDKTPRKTVSVPHGYMARLEQMHEGGLIGFGPFVGYYFRPEDPQDLSRLRFVCFNENGFYSSDMAKGAKLYEGEAVRITLPDADLAIPAEDRINPIFFVDAPDAWLESRPNPKDEFLHFHSCYNGVGPVRTGYWIRHTAVTDFTYDMGGKVGKDSPLYHKVGKGLDPQFARIIEFDRGPREGG